jgi:hypothetical protein
VAANVIVNLVPTLHHRLPRKALSVSFHLHVVLASVTWQCASDREAARRWRSALGNHSQCNLACSALPKPTVLSHADKGQ